jgi:hypothetical protein
MKPISLVFFALFSAHQRARTLESSEGSTVNHGGASGSVTLRDGLNNETRHGAISSKKVES